MIVEGPAIGASLRRPDALGKVTGATAYPGDLVRPGMLRLKVVFARRAHARIRAIDTSHALAYPGVVAVFTAADVPYNRHGLIDDDQPVLCEDRVRFEGDKVALVAAESAEAAAAGAALVVVDYEDLPTVTNPRAALEPDAPLVHEERGTNLLLHVPIRKGDTARALATADIVLDGAFTTSWQEHAFLQPEAGVAHIDESGRVVVETAGQWLHEDRRQIAAMLRVPDDEVIVRYAAIGGAFGGREDLSIQHLLALSAWRLKRSVALVWDREESIIAHHKRHPMTVRCRWGATHDGCITAVESTVVADGGAYASTSAEVIKVAALFATGAYEVPHIHVDGYAVYTNNVPSGAFRGFGAPQAQFASEVMVTRLAHALGLDPVDMRRRNLYREGSVEPTGDTLPTGVSARVVLDRCVEEARARLGYVPHPPTPLSLTVGEGEQPPSPPPHADWAGDSAESPAQPTPPPRGRGGNCADMVGGASPLPRQGERAGPAIPRLGIGGPVSHGTGVRAAGDESRAPHIQRGIGIACGIKNIGYSFGFPEQSTATVELFGRGEVERARVRVGAADVGQGSHLALRQIAAHMLQLPPEAVEMVCDDSAEAPNAGSASASRLTLMAGRAVHDATAEALEEWARTDDQHVRATVQYRPPTTTSLDPVTGAARPNYAYGYVAQAVEVEVNTLTGQVRALSVISVHDVGKAINRQQVEGQIEGCVAQGIGYALLEDLKTRNGRILTPHLSTYLLPTVLDMPEVMPVVLELADPNGPFGARGVAEMPLVPITPAIAAAIHDATGAWVIDQPMTPERVLRALTGQ